MIADLAQRGIASKPYLPCIHLMPHYRERFGFRGGEFPVAEAVAERSLALPFFPAMTEPQVERVVRGALRGARIEGLGVTAVADSLVEDRRRARARSTPCARRAARPTA